MVEKDDNPAFIFADSLNNLKKKFLEYTVRLKEEKEKAKKLEECIEINRQQLYKLQSQTKNGNIVKESHGINDKAAHLNEKKLQAEKVKLSVAKTENVEMHAKINELRKEKLLQLHINDLVDRELNSLQIQVKKMHDDIADGQMNKKNIETLILEAKNNFATDRKVFSKQLALTKQEIFSNQEQIYKLIEEGLLKYEEKITESLRRRQKATLQLNETTQDLNENDEYRKRMAGDNLASAKISSACAFEDLSKEEECFLLYHRIQTKVEEFESLQATNSQLEKQINSQESLDSSKEYIEACRRHTEFMIKEEAKLDLEARQRETSCAVLSKALRTIATSCMGMFEHVALEDDAGDEHIRTVGITERSVFEFLSIFEQRLDDVLQVHAALMKQPLKTDRFLPPPVVRRKQHSRHTRPQRIPTVEEIDDHN